MLFWLFMLGIVPLWLRESPVRDGLREGTPDVPGDSALGDCDSDQRHLIEDFDVGEVAESDFALGLGSDEPTVGPSDEPTVGPSDEPTVGPSDEPTVGPGVEPTVGPSGRAAWDDSLSDSTGPVDDLGSEDGDQFNRKPNS
jgi:hypothetical protein